MNPALILAAVTLAGAAFFDGWTTVRFLKNPDYVEGGAVWLLGRRPSTLRVYGLGGLVIAAEIAVGLLFNHFSVFAGYALALAYGYQAYAHIHAGIANLKIPVPV
jgi:hypothetical protein